MNREILVGAGIDYDSGVRRFAGRANLYEKALSKFPEEGTFARVRADYESNDTEQLLRDAHEFKGMCGNIALCGLFNSAVALIALLKTEAWTQEELDAAYNDLKREYNAVIDALRAAMEV